MVITAAQLHSTKLELRFCTGPNPVRGMSSSSPVQLCAGNANDVSAREKVDKTIPEVLLQVC